MGVLKKLTDEYFGETVREEDSTVSKLLHKCIEKNKRESFVSKFKKWDNKNTYLLYRKNKTLTNEAETMEPTEAISYMENKKKTFQFGYVGLSKETFLATPDFYRKNTPNYEKMDDNIKQVIDKIFEEFYKYPEIDIYNDSNELEYLGSTLLKYFLIDIVELIADIYDFKINYIPKVLIFAFWV